jgi:hypothetical protein
VRKVLLMAALCALAVLAVAPAAFAIDYDCSDFTTKAQAQAKLLPGDPYGLDADGDGQACDDLPSGGAMGGGSTASPTSSPTASLTSSPTASPTASPSASPSASPTASATSSAAGAAQYQYTPALPSTGGVSPATLAILPAILLVGGGLLFVSAFRRS